jgi:hypothetical protein
MVGQELHMDGKTEDKLFAPGYGEFYTRDGKDVEALALAVPTDALSAGVPSDLAVLETGAKELLDQAGTGAWKAASASFDRMSSSWTRYRAGGVPKLIEPVMSGFLRSLGAAVQAHQSARARHLALEVARSSLDLQLRYRPVTDVDLARMDLWAAQILLDASAHDAGSVRADVFALVYIRDRILGALSASDLTNVNTLLQGLEVSATDENFQAASRGAERLRATLAGLVSRSMTPAD